VGLLAPTDDDDDGGAPSGGIAAGVGGTAGGADLAVPLGAAGVIALAVDTPQARLRLITCGGAFDRRSGHYLDNVVVYADRTG
jgi:hypothetical protein